jgi:hypothetical protein
LIYLRQLQQIPICIFPWRGLAAALAQSNRIDEGLRLHNAPEP